MMEQSTGISQVHGDDGVGGGGGGEDEWVLVSEDEAMGREEAVGGGGWFGMFTAGGGGVVERVEDSGADEGVGVDERVGDEGVGVDEGVEDEWVDERVEDEGEDERVEERDEEQCLEHRNVLSDEPHSQLQDEALAGAEAVAGAGAEAGVGETPEIESLVEQPHRVEPHTPPQDEAEVPTTDADQAEPDALPTKTQSTQGTQSTQSTQMPAFQVPGTFDRPIPNTTLAEEVADLVQKLRCTLGWGPT